MKARDENPVVPDFDVFLHEPARLRLLVLLSVLNRADFVFLLRQSAMTRGNLSAQMSKLSEAGMVSIEKSFVDNRPRTAYQLTPKGKAALRKYKASMLDLLFEIPD